MTTTEFNVYSSHMIIKFTPCLLNSTFFSFLSQEQNSFLLIAFKYYNKINLSCLYLAKRKKNQSLQ